MITVYNDVVLPHSIIAAAGLRGRTMRKNQRSRSQSGFENININWMHSLRQYDLGYIPMRPSVWRTIEGLHEVTDGGAYGFLLQDPKDSTAAVGSLMQPIVPTISGSTPVGTIGFGYGVPSYKLYKRVTSVGTTRTKDRPVTRPMVGATFLRNGSPPAIAATPGSIAIDYDSGTVTFVADSTLGINSITTGASTIVNTGSAIASVGQRIHFSGITGTAAAALNNLSHLVTATDGLTLTVSTSTTGLSGSGGQAKRFPQLTDTLTWGGSFYTPVHFESDDLDWELLAGGPEEKRVIAGRGVTLVEVRE